MSLKQYRSLDLLIFSILAMASEFMGTFLLEKFIPGFTISFASLIAIIAIFRWGPAGGIVYVLSGLPIILLYNDSFYENLLFYLGGNSFIFIVPLLIRKPRNSIRDKTFSFNLYILLIYVSVIVGRALMVFVLGEELIGALRAVMGSLLFTIVVSTLLLNLLKKANGLITDMYVLIEESKTERTYESRSENV
ncbi:MAG TPA: hypothetical protein VIK96_00865 [Bacilli bacterium]